VLFQYHFVKKQKEKHLKFGSVCSGIEAASFAFKPFGVDASWFSEIAEFPKSILKTHYQNIPNFGDMNDLPKLIRDGEAEAPEILCGGTPCQAFSLAGWREGLVDGRGQLTLKFIEVADAIDDIREKEGKNRAIILWENVEGVLRDRTNAFGVFISGLAGLDEEIKVKKWTTSGVLFGPIRNVAWRVLDAKYFGLPQQRRRLFLIATPKDMNPEILLFEKTLGEEDVFSCIGNKKVHGRSLLDFEKEKKLSFYSTDPMRKIKYIDGHKIEIFREYTDCLYSAYGTKWNGNAAAYNGSLYVSQNDKIRRLTPLECERLMGFPDNYTLIPGATDTSRYQAIGNSWAIPVVKWIAGRIVEGVSKKEKEWICKLTPSVSEVDYRLFLFKEKFVKTPDGYFINASESKNDVETGDIFDIIDVNAKQKFYISPKACQGILRRKKEKNLKMNEYLEEIFEKNSVAS